MCTIIWPACMCVNHVWAWCLMRSEEGTGSLGTVDADGCESPHGFWEQNLGPL